ncbi:MAG TPA: LPS assembly protein LptD [Caulobacteraceae bacterium]|nr:LPS assembly protein LptD [Caulobacteraceae bacterium]
MTLVSRVGVGLAASRRLKLALLAGALVLVPTLALASPRETKLSTLPTLAPPPAPPKITPPPDDGLQDGGFYIEADQLTDDDTNHIVTATGQVEARYNGRTLRANQVTYNVATGIVVAIGDVTIINPDGSAEFSQSAELDREMSAGVAMAFSTRLKAAGLQEDISIAAESVVRASPTVTEMNEAVFTPCTVCAKKPIPTWSIRAKKVVQDKIKHTITFHDAVIQIHGVPVMYLPVIWEADQDTKRKSGLLIPEVSVSSLRGFSYEQPYLQVISPSEDIVISPQINTKVNPFLNVDWRKRFYDGAIDVRAGYTYEEDFNSAGQRLGNPTSRSYILAKGLFAIDNNWDWGFTAERASDPLIFDRYGVADPFVDRGLYAADDRRLISQLYTTREDQDSYLSIAAIDVQGLRTTDINNTFPAVAPLIEAHYDPTTPVFGGRLRLNGSGVVLVRDNSPDDPTLPGVDSRRATLDADWQRTFIVGPGVRVDAFLDARADFYSLASLSAPYAKDATIARSVPTGGFTVSWPFYKNDGTWTWVVQPIAQLAISPVVRQDPRIPDEDSVDFEFDYTNLFQIDKSPGFDLIDSGQRLNVGGEATVQNTNGFEATALIGREFRAQADPDIPARTGLAGTQSDWIAYADVTPIKNVRFFTSWRLDSRTLGINRLEAGADFQTSRFDGQIRYLQEAEDPTGARVQDLDFHAEWFVLGNWGISAYGAREFTSGVWREQEFGVVYRDKCIRVEVLYRRDNTFNGVLGPSSGVGLRLSLATLSNSIYAPSETNTPAP